jgi:hypothetical protein
MKYFNCILSHENIIVNELLNFNSSLKVIARLSVPNTELEFQRRPARNDIQ